MSDGFGMELQHDGKADFFGSGGGFVFTLREDRENGGDAVEFEDFFGLKFGEQRASGVGSGFEQAGGLFLCGR